MPKYDKSQYSLKKVYSHYRKRCKERGVEPVDFKKHKLILDTWGLKVVEYLAAGKDVQLHSGLASLQIRKKRVESYVDFKASREAGKAVNIKKRQKSAKRTAKKSLTTDKAMARSKAKVIKKLNQHFDALFYFHIFFKLISFFFYFFNFSTR